MGGWSVVKSLRQSGVRKKGDARILGSGKFVMQVIDESKEKIRKQFAGDNRIERAEKPIHDYCAEYRVDLDVLFN